MDVGGHVGCWQWGLERFSWEKVNLLRTFLSDQVT